METKRLTHDARERERALPVPLEEPAGQCASRGDEAHYSDEAFWDKATRYARKAGRMTLAPGLKLYYSAQDPDTPVWAKTTIYGALGYFIFPLDTIPDVTPLAGYTDDVSVLVGALAVVAAHVKDEHVAKARATLTRWFGE
ncbi:Uncharacterized membrane protein YkvA, DUF1232 family [Modicisalibacter ilicicola DSM 19980]|uniref:Uncharacterized membrane protein YkvA, DUF1232 family n=1 Tax=Modicisalibacter ilicicola DSM 19980 TaxID=1121942 RepID=A0A1M5B0D8_9GAMM|nr:YkvA family protein [Halomonas ilicicola]SHF35777.1 Uncharacterized membrane protein YkvA, DUF1232 family [Halomonas ilicicola DSM 19980]